MSRAPMAADGETYKDPEAPEVERAFRAAYRALESLIPARTLYVHEKGAHFDEIVSAFHHMVEEAWMVLVSHLGPRTGWQAKRTDTFGLVLAGIDLDEGEHDFGPERLYASEGNTGDWAGSPLDQAARAYRREADWDFAPGEAGIWLLMLAPTCGFGGDSSERAWHYNGHICGFVILYDRDDDGTYESVGHIWTGKAWRRQGIAARLLAEARSRFGASRIEGPATDDGGALVKAAWPEIAP